MLASRKRGGRGPEWDQMDPSTWIAAIRITDLKANRRLYSRVCAVQGNTRQCSECPQGNQGMFFFILSFFNFSTAKCFPERDGLLTVNMKTGEMNSLLFLKKRKSSMF